MVEWSRRAYLESVLYGRLLIFQSRTFFRFFLDLLPQPFRFLSASPYFRVLRQQINSLITQYASTSKLHSSKWQTLMQIRNFSGTFSLSTVSMSMILAWTSSRSFSFSSNCSLILPNSSSRPLTFNSKCLLESVSFWIDNLKCVAFSISVVLH